MAVGQMVDVARDREGQEDLVDLVDLGDMVEEVGLREGEGRQRKPARRARLLRGRRTS